MRQEKDNIKDGGAAYSERTLPRCLYGDMAVWNRENGTFRGILMYSLPEQNPQVLQQYLESHENEDGAACQLGLGFIAASKWSQEVVVPVVFAALPVVRLNGG